MLTSPGRSSEDGFVTARGARSQLWITLGVTLATALWLAGSFYARIDSPLPALPDVLGWALLQLVGASLLALCCTRLENLTLRTGLAMTLGLTYSLGVTWWARAQHVRLRDVSLPLDPLVLGVVAFVGAVLSDKLGASARHGAPRRSRRWPAMMLLALSAVVLTLPQWLLHETSDGCITRSNRLKAQANMLRHAAFLWKIRDQSHQCPTVRDLMLDRVLEPDTPLPEDPWGWPLTVECYEDEIVVRSAGSDGVLGTEDDFVVPAARDRAEPE